MSLSQAYLDTTHCLPPQVKCGESGGFVIDQLDYLQASGPVAIVPV